MGGGGDIDEVFYNFTGTKVTKLKVRIKEPGNYGLGYIGGDISTDKPTIIDWGNGKTTKVTSPYLGDSNATYSESGEYIISIDGWYNSFRCEYPNNTVYGITNIAKVLTEVIQVSSLITSFNRTFEGCSSLTSIPTGLFDNNTNVTNFFYAFHGCSSLTGETPYTLSSDGKKIKLWDRDGTNGFVKPTETRGVFCNCTGLTDYKDIPDVWKQTN